jgi:5,10-methylenetetrahydromethanopterin reductase
VADLTPPASGDLGSIPLLIGTWSSRLTAFAAAHADELKLGGSANPALVELAADRLGPTATHIAIVVGAVTVVDRDSRRARACARRRVAMYLSVVASLDPTAALDPELSEALAERLQTGDDAGAGRLIPDDVLDLFAFSGTPAQVASQVEALFAAGARRVDFGAPYGLDERAGVELLIREVAPHLRR